MAQYQIKDLSDDSIAYRYEADQAEQQTGMFGGPWDSPALYVHELVPQYTLDEEAVLATWAELRAARDVKMKEVDRARWDMSWADASGTAWTQQTKDDWAAYRQALLDVPENVVDITAVDVPTFTWPTKPQDRTYI